MSDINPIQAIFGFLERFTEDHRNYICSMVLAMDARSKSDIDAVFASKVDYWAVLKERFASTDELPFGPRGKTLALRSYVTAELKRLVSEDHARVVRGVFSDKDMPDGGIDREAHLQRFERQLEELLSHLPDWYELVATTLTDEAIEDFVTQEMIERHKIIQEGLSMRFDGTRLSI